MYGLKVFELEEMFEFLMNLVQLMGLIVGNAEREGNICNNYHIEHMVFEGKHKLYFSREFSFVPQEE